jgi:hypothetical protein
MFLKFQKQLLVPILTFFFLDGTFDMVLRLILYSWPSLILSLVPYLLHTIEWTFWGALLVCSTSAHISKYKLCSIN